MTKNKNKYLIFSILFVVLNALITYVVTTQTFNKYIVTFDFSLVGFINSFIGNAGFLLFILTIVNLCSKNNNKKMISLIVISFLLSGILFAINIYNRYYGTSFTFSAFAIFKNPAESVGLTIFFESMREIITYFRIILFIPFFILIIYYFVNRKLIDNTPLVENKGVLITTISFMLMFFINITSYGAIAREMDIVDSAKPTHSTQYIGIYNYLLVDAVGYDFTKEAVEDELLSNLDDYNKNKDEYINIIDGKTYTKEVLLKDIDNISGKLVENLNPNDSITGILEDYNLVLIHLESLNYFLLDNPILSQHFYNLNFLLSESYVFENFYSNVGLGNSSDAELSVLAGLYSNGTSTPFWNYNPEEPTSAYDLQTLAKLFNKQNYETMSYHGNDETFYNRNIVHPQMIGFNKFHSRETILEYHGKTIDEIQEQYNHETGLWLTDRITVEYLNNDINNNLINNEQFFKFVITMLPHLPYHYDPYHPDPYDTEMFPEEFVNEIDYLSLKYFNFIKYYNESFNILFEDVNGYGDDYVYDENNLYNRDKTAYIFYGDHGSGISDKDVNYLYNNELDPIEAKNKLLQTISFIYVPGKNNVTKTIDGREVTFKEGLLKGKQSLVRDQMDLYRTIVNLFDLELDEDDYLFGAHGMSSEPSFSLDNKSLNIITDNFITNLISNNDYYYNEEVTVEMIDRFKELVVTFKKSSDYALNNNLYRRQNDK